MLRFTFALYIFESYYLFNDELKIKKVYIFLSARTLFSFCCLLARTIESTYLGFLCGARSVFKVVEVCAYEELA